MGTLTTLALTNRLRALAKAPSDKPIRITDGAGLQLYVKPGQSTGSWVLRYTFHGRRSDLGLGAHPAVSLAEARRLANEAHAQIRLGIDPKLARTAARTAHLQAAAAAKARAVTFEAAAEAAIAAKRDGWSNAKHAAQWLASLKQHAFPKLGSMPVGDITTTHVLDVLKPIWTTRTETASRIRQRIEAVLDHARVKGWRDGENPARWRSQLAELLPAPRKVSRVEHQPALPWADMPAFMAALAKVEGMGARALTFAILTAARTGEVRGARWREINRDTGTWTIPPERMKARRVHRVALSEAALDLLAKLRPATAGPNDLVFPGQGGGTLSDMTISAVIRRMNKVTPTDPRWVDQVGRPVVPHGFRSTFRDWAGESREEPREVVERALAHTISNETEAAYARSDLLDKRRPLMAAWGTHCTPAPLSDQAAVADSPDIANQ